MNPTQTYQDRLARLRKATAAAVARLWDDLPDLHRERALPFAEAAVPIVRAGQRNAANVTASYLRRQLRDIRTPTIPADLRGVDPLEVYQRPFGITWKALGDGKTLDEARLMGRNRIDDLTKADVMLAARAAATLIAASRPTLLWRRDADGAACELCTGAAGTIYRSPADLAIHPGCGCTVSPFEGNSAPADPDAFTVRVSDELGPVLWHPGHDFAAA